VLERDSEADGHFFYAVTSTGIYCRPGCPSRRPGRERVRFFDAPSAAESAGFRPCRRCRPTEVPKQQRVVAAVINLLREAAEPPTLSELGRATGLSPFHLQRVFKRSTGVSPKQYAAALRAERLKAQLKGGVTVTEALYEAGYGSSRALYDQAPERLGMTPGAYRNGGAGEQIAYGCFETALGMVLVAATARGVCYLQFGEPDRLTAELRGEFPRATLVELPPAVSPFAAAVRSFLAGERHELDLPLDVHATAFQERVWAALREIPVGQVRSYREVAAMIGQPAAVRAVGRACATNPVALAIPCHRVVRSDGSVSGFRWGVDRKVALLKQEREIANRESGR
jgi:AraC family transcriptional regulator, regulatory protein of adaptative response / methylated-DNA-[protein]-cysteine methyltransferase